MWRVNASLAAWVGVVSCVHLRSSGGADKNLGASGLLHKALVTTSGAVGGSFGLAALPIELPISTIIMLRSIGGQRVAGVKT